MVGGLGKERYPKANGEGVRGYLIEGIESQKGLLVVEVEEGEDTGVALAEEEEGGELDKIRESKHSLRFTCSGHMPLVGSINLFQLRYQSGRTDLHI